MRPECLDFPSRGSAASLAAIAFGLIAPILLLGSSPATFGAETAPAPAPDAVAQAIAQALAAPSPPWFENEALDMAALRRFYAARGDQPVWTGDPVAGERAGLLTGAISRADEDGLDPADYHAPALGRRSAQRSAAESARDDLALSHVFLRYARELRVGRMAPGELSGDVSLPSQAFDPAVALERALSEGGFARLLADLPPSEPDYARLKQALYRYRAILAAGGWPQIPGGGEIKLDGSDPRAALLRKRLAIEDEALAATADKAQPGDLAAALRRFQARHGLAPDGRAGRETLAAVNIPAAERVGQILTNMERWRWMPRPLEARRVMVNVPAATLEVIEDGKPVLTSKVVVGDRGHPSPILWALATAVTVNPPWNVPPSIARKEILPKLRRNPRYLVSQNMVVLNGPIGDPHGLAIDWRAVSASGFPYRLQQLPGPQNSLGVVKLEMPNAFDVYLHDTPAKRLFARAERALSHGCIRVEAAFELASLALGGDRQQRRTELNAAIAAGVTQQLPIDPPLPVYLVYWTAYAGTDGAVEFRPDLYGRDARLAAALAGHHRPELFAQAQVGCGPTMVAAKTFGLTTRY